MKQLVLILLFLGIGALVGGYLGRPAAVPVAAAPATDHLESELGVALELIRHQAAVRPDERHLLGSAIRYLLRRLDPHTTFFEPAEFRRLLEENRGRYFGLGVSVRLMRRVSGQVMIIAPPRPGSPAALAGLRAGDVICRIDGAAVDDWDLATVVAHLKGEAGTTVSVSILRPGETGLLDFQIRRAEIPELTIPYSFCIRPGIGYVRLEYFSETTHQELRNALRRLDYHRLDGLILDLRDNPGGLMVQAIRVAQEFLPRGAAIVSTRGRDPADRQEYAAFEQGDLKVPLVVLINGQSASAAEIVASAIQDNDRGLVAGERSFGKGLVQTVYRLADGSGLSLTTARYYAPSGRCLQRPFGDSIHRYYRHRPTVPAEAGEERYTFGQRKVYGGGGVMPDIPVAPDETDHFRRLLQVRDAFFRFIGQARGGEVPSLPAEVFGQAENARHFMVTAAVKEDFAHFLADIGVPVTAGDLARHDEFIERGLRAEVVTRLLGLNDGYRIRADGDQQIRRALDVMPQSRHLLLRTRRLLAERRSLFTPESF